MHQAFLCSDDIADNYCDGLLTVCQAGYACLQVGAHTTES